MGLFDKIKKGIKHSNDFNIEREKRLDKRKAGDVYDAKLEELVDAYFKEHAGYLITLCKEDKLKGHEQELINALFNPFDIDLSDVSFEMKQRVLEICSENQDLIDYICKVADCRPEEICFDESPVEGQTVVFGNLKGLRDKNVMPKYVFGDFSLSVSSGDYKGIEHIGGSLTAGEGKGEQSFPDLKSVRGHIMLPNVITSLPKLEKVGGSVAICGRKEPDEDLKSLKSVGGKFYVLNFERGLNEAWAKFEEERNLNIDPEFDSYEARRLFDKAQLSKCRNKAVEQVTREFY